MNINLFSPALQLALLTACRARGPSHPSREGLPSPWLGATSLVLTGSVAVFT